MPSTIPYDPSLVLGNIVVPDVLDNLTAIAALQGPVDSAQDTLNSYISMKRSIDMTVQELVNMNVDPKELTAKSEEVGKAISKAAIDYATSRLEQETKIQPLRAKIPVLHKSIESPIDYNRTQIKQMPLAADSLKMDAQYFSYDSNEQKAQNQVSSIKKFIAASVRFLGDDVATEISDAASEQVNRQRETHNVEGTLVLTAACTHKNAQVLAPFILDVDKAVRVWNKMYPAAEDLIKADDIANMRDIARGSGAQGEKSISLLSGATYGSSFVGMVHVLASEQTTTSQKMNSVAASMQVVAEVGVWLENESGGFGMDRSVSDDIKKLLSTQNVTSHISLITMGLIPSIKSNAVQIAVKQITEFDPKAMGDQLALLANTTENEKSTMSSAAASARTGAKMVAIKNAEISSVMSALGSLDSGSDKVLNVNSMMTAFEDYVDKAIEGSIGVPINFYVKEVTRAQIAEMWVAKYYPNKFLSISGDDRARPSGQGNAGNGDGSDSSDGDSSNNNDNN